MIWGLSIGISPPYLAYAHWIFNKTASRVGGHTLRESARKSAKKIGNFWYHTQFDSWHSKPFSFFFSFFFSVTIFATRFYIGYSPGGESGRRKHNGGGGGGRLVELPKPKVTLGGGQGSPVRVPAKKFFWFFFCSFGLPWPTLLWQSGVGFSVRPPVPPQNQGRKYGQSASLLIILCGYARWVWK